MENEHVATYIINRLVTQGADIGYLEGSDVDILCQLLQLAIHQINPGSPDAHTCIMDPLILNFNHPEIAAFFGLTNFRTSLRPGAIPWTTSIPLTISFTNGTPSQQSQVKTTIVNKLQPFLAMKLVFGDAGPQKTSVTFGKTRPGTGGVARAGKSTSSYVVFNANVNLTDSLILHEFMHVLGADHTTYDKNDASVMTPVAIGGVTELSPKDKEWLVQTYGPTTTFRALEPTCVIQ